MYSSDYELLFSAISAYGGQYEFETTVKSTHIIYLCPHSSLISTESQGMMFHVKASWIEDSLQSMKRLPIHSYLLSLSTPLRPDTINQYNDDNHYKEVNHYKEINNFKIYIEPQSRSRDLDDTLRGFAIHPQLEADTQIFISNHQTSQMMSISKKYVIGTVEWLIECIKSKYISDPTLHCLHFPSPLKPIKGLENAVICLSGYANQDRKYIKRMLALMGFKSTGEMSIHNTHLLLKVKDNKKYLKSLEWPSIKVVSCKWLETCFVNWKVSTFNTLCQ